MSRLVIGVALSLVVSCADVESVPRSSGATCGGDTCAGHQRCDVPTQRCVLDEAPSLTVAGPQGAVTTPRFTLSGAAEDDVQLTELAYRIDQGTWTPVEVSSSGVFTLDLPTPPADAVTLDVVVRAADGAHVVERPVHVLVDRVAPRIELVMPKAGAVISSARLAATVSVQDGSAGLQQLLIGGKPVPSPRPGLTTADVELSPSGVVTVEAVDVNGNHAVQQVTLTLDVTAPSLSFLAPMAASSTSGARFRPVVQARDDSEVVEVLLSVEGAAPVRATPASDGTWSADLSLPATDGEVHLVAEASDRAGHRAAVTSAALRLDRVAPQVTLLTPAAGAVVNAAFPVRAQAGVDAVAVEARLGAASAALTLGADGLWTGTVPLPLSGDAVPATLTLTARDAAGNVSAPVARPLVVDTVAPRVTFTAPVAGSTLNASRFTTGEDVVVTWRIEDGDTTAGTRTINGHPSQATEARVVTSATDDGRRYTVTVVARDALNEGTASLDFTVDRVAPAVVSWSPAGNARNVEPREVRVTFSEAVFAGQASAPALLLSPAAPAAGSWDSGHRTWTQGLLTPYTVFTAALAGVTDAAGNPVAPQAPRRFHTAALAPASGTVLGTGIGGFSVVADADGVVTLATSGASGTQVRRLSPVTGQLEATPLLSLPRLTSVELGAWTTVDPVTLAVSPLVTAAYRGSTSLVRQVLLGPAPLPSLAETTGTAALVAAPPLPGEGTSQRWGSILGAQYQRDGFSLTLPTAPVVVAPASTGWVGASVEASAVRWSRFTCFAETPVQPLSCTAYAFTAPASAAAALRAVQHPAGTCFVATWREAGSARTVFQPLRACERQRPTDPVDPSCASGSAPAVASSSDDLRVAPFTGGGEATLLASRSQAGGFQLLKLSSPAACAPSFTPLGAPLSDAVRQAEPVQVGNRPGLLYRDGSDTLKLYVP